MPDQKALFETGSSYHHLQKSVHSRQASPPRASFSSYVCGDVVCACATLASTLGIKRTAAKRGSTDSLGFMAAASLFGLKGMGASGASPNTSGSLARKQTRARMTKQFLNLNRSTINIVICLKTKT